MKKAIIIAVSCLLAAGLLLGGIRFGKYLHSKNVPDFENYSVVSYSAIKEPNDISAVKETETLKAKGYVINRPIWNGISAQNNLELCYGELEEACYAYADHIAKKYRNKAKLSVEVDVDKTAQTVTITFGGTGYAPDGSEDELSRTYVFDVDGAGVNKLPRLVNKAEFFPEL